MSSRLFRGLRKAREFLRAGLGRIQPQEWEEIEEILIQTDMDISTVEEIISQLKFSSSLPLRETLKKELLTLFPSQERTLKTSPVPPTVILVIGVNGVGKTTSIGKLAYYFRKKGGKVLLSASDTFRAAAIEQLLMIGEKAGVEVVKQQYGADPAAVAFDALEKAISRKYDYLIVDTAGRMHSDRNLLEELKKIKRVLNTRFHYSNPPPPHEILLVLDANVGKNSLQQAEEFHKSVGVTGVFLAKMDSSARGGIVLSIERKLGIPVKWMGVGEGLEDMVEFNPQEFVENLIP